MKLLENGFASRQKSAKIQIRCQRGECIDAELSVRKDTAMSEMSVDSGEMWSGGISAETNMSSAAVISAEADVPSLIGTSTETGIPPVDESSADFARMLSDGGYANAVTLSEVIDDDGIRVEVSESVSDGCVIGRLSLAIEMEPRTGDRYFAMDRPVRLFLPLQERPEKITALYLYNNWWTRPAFTDSLRDIPDRTQIAFFRFAGSVTCVVPLAGEQFKAVMTGGYEEGVCLELTAHQGGQSQMNELVYVAAEAETAAEAARAAFTEIAARKNICLRRERRLPEIFRYPGWCSWNAYYTDVTAEKLCEKALELKEKQVPVRWMLIDDGWLDVKDSMLRGFEPDGGKFPDGFGPVTRKLRNMADIRWFGVWHAICGYWGGLDPDGPLAVSESSHLRRTVNGRLVPDPLSGAGFFSDWYDVLKRQGIDFVKVDDQSSLPFFFGGSASVCEAARGLNGALENGASRLDGAVINCMGMAMENVLARPATAVSRNSDDFMPDREESFVEHLLQNAYNSLYHDELYVCDWDMFWTKHRYAAKHAFLRAVSGGPVYISDKPGETDPEVLKPLTDSDGRIFMMDRSARPTEDCVFTDPRRDGVLKLSNTASWGGAKAGGVAVFNLTDRPQAFQISPKDIPELEMSEEYWVYDYFNRKLCSLGREEVLSRTAEPDGFGWYVFLPRRGLAACLGLLDKYVGFAAVESVCETGNARIESAQVGNVKIGNAQPGSAQTVILKSSGRIGWAAEKAPRKVYAAAADVTDMVEADGQLYSLMLPETAGQTAVTIVW